MTEDELFSQNMKANEAVQEGCYNPAVKVFFRAGILACREIMARFVEQGGDTTTAASIRANWFPSLGADPGTPRQFNCDEIADEQPSGRIEHKPMDASFEALAFAWAFIKGNEGKPE